MYVFKDNEGNVIPVDNDLYDKYIRHLTSKDFEDPAAIFNENPNVSRREFDLTVLLNGSPIDLESTMGSFTYEMDMGEDDYPIGTSPYKTLKVTMKNNIKYLDNKDGGLKGAVVEPIIKLKVPDDSSYTGYKYLEVPFGKYKVETVERSISQIILTCYDELYFLDREKAKSEYYYGDMYKGTGKKYGNEANTIGNILLETYSTIKPGERISFNEDDFVNGNGETLLLDVMRQPKKYKDIGDIIEVDDGDGDDGEDELLPDDDDALEDDYLDDEGEEDEDNEYEEPGSVFFLEEYWPEGSPRYAKDLDGWDISKPGGGKFNSSNVVLGKQKGVLTRADFAVDSNKIKELPTPGQFAEYFVGKNGKLVKEDGSIYEPYISEDENNIFSGLEFNTEKDFKSYCNTTTGDFEISFCEHMNTHYYSIQVTSLNKKLYLDGMGLSDKVSGPLDHILQYFGATVEAEVETHYIYTESGDDFYEGSDSYAYAWLRARDEMSPNILLADGTWRGYCFDESDREPPDLSGDLGGTEHYESTYGVGLASTRINEYTGKDFTRVKIYLPHFLEDDALENQKYLERGDLRYLVESCVRPLQYSGKAVFENPLYDDCNVITNYIKSDAFKDDEVLLEYEVVYYGSKKMSNEHWEYLTGGKDIKNYINRKGKEYFEHCPNCGGHTVVSEKPTSKSSLYTLEEAAKRTKSLSYDSNNNLVVALDEGEPGEPETGRTEDTTPQKIGQDMTVAELLRYIGGYCGGNIFLDHDNVIRLLKLNKNNGKARNGGFKVDKDITPDQYTTPSINDSDKSAMLGGLIVQTSELDVVSSVPHPPSEDSSYYVIDTYNPFLQDNKARLDEIIGEMGQVRYYPINTTILGDPRLTLGDILGFEEYMYKRYDPITGNDNEIQVLRTGVYPIMKLTGTFDSTVGMQIESTCTNSADRTDEYKGTLTEKVDNLNNNMNSVADTVTKVSTDLEKIKILVAYINKLFAIEVNADNIITGTLNTKYVKVRSDSDGSNGLFIDGDSISWVDNSGKQRIHIGSDGTQQDYYIKLADKTGYTRDIKVIDDDKVEDQYDVSSLEKKIDRLENTISKLRNELDEKQTLEELEKRIKKLEDSQNKDENEE